MSDISTNMYFEFLHFSDSNMPQSLMITGFVGSQLLKSKKAIEAARQAAS